METMISGVPKRLIVIGGGLAGVSAVIQAAKARNERGLPDIKVTLLEKMAKAGGNSAKASSGINSLNPPAGDSKELFVSDVTKSGGGLSNAKLVDILVAQSQDALNFLTSHELDLSSVSRLGGHSVPRSHANPSGPNVGYAIMSNLLQTIRALPEVSILENTKADELVMEGGRVVGVKVTQTLEDGSSEVSTLPASAVIIATGGFSANKELLTQVNPAAANLPTTNGPWAQGEGLKLAEAAGANLIQLDQVQVHPTGFINPKEPKAGTKFLAPEKLRGVGAILLNASGRRFVDELDLRDRVTATIMQQPNKMAFLLLPQKAAATYGQAAIDFYVKMGLMQKADNADAAASLMSISPPNLAMELVFYNTVQRTSANQPAAETLDPNTILVHDNFGKTFFPSPIDANEPMYVGKITPVVHYTMGGIEVDERARALSKEGGAPLPGLYAVGEASGGVHGRNRLGGNSLLECVVFGRIAGGDAIEYISQQSSTAETAA